MRVRAAARRLRRLERRRERRPRLRARRLLLLGFIVEQVGIVVLMEEAEHLHAARRARSRRGARRLEALERRELALEVRRLEVVVVRLSWLPAVAGVSCFAAVRGSCGTAERRAAALARAVGAARAQRLLR